MNKLIISADDYGMSQAVNEAIDEGVEVGLITSTNVMTNMPFYKEASKLKANHNVSVGIHFTLSCGYPVSDPKEIPTLIAPNGEFYKYPEFRQRYRKKLIKEQEIITELKAQYARFVEVLGQPDYWNTHQNVHVDFRIYRLFVDLARELGIHKMRSHQRIYVPESVKANRQSLVWRLIEPIKSRMLDTWQENAHKKGIGSPDGLIVCLNNADINRMEYVFANIKWGRKTVGEYVIHPATRNDSPYFGRIVDQRLNEYQMFTSTETKNIIEKSGIELVTFAEITKK